MASLESLAGCRGPLGEQGHDMQRHGFGSNGNRDTVMAHRFPAQQATAGVAGRRVVARLGSTGRLQLVNKREDCRQSTPTVGLHDRLN